MLEGYKAMAEFISEEFSMCYSHRTLQRWTRRHSLPARRARTGRVYVEAEALRGWFQRTIAA